MSTFVKTPQENESISQEPLEQLTGSLMGTLLLPGNDGYDL